MILDLIKGIALKLNEVFGDKYEVYQNDVAQGLTEPCFLIAILEPSRKKRIGPRYQYINPFVITYFPRNAGSNEEMIGVAETMTEELEVITLPNGEQVRGTDIRFEIVDNTLHFFVNYNTHMIKPTDSTFMGEVDVTVGIKKG